MNQETPRPSAPASPLLSAYSRLRLRLRRMAAALLGDAEADDALQEAFIRLWQRPLPHDEAEASRLLTVTVRHLSIDTLRRRQTAREVPLADAADVEAEASPDDRLAAVEQILADSLTPLQRDIVSRHDYEGQTYAHIAAELGMAEPAVRMQLSRARQKIREIYQSRYGNEH